MKPLRRQNQILPGIPMMHRNGTGNPQTAAIAGQIAATEDKTIVIRGPRRLLAFEPQIFLVLANRINRDESRPAIPETAGIVQ